MQHSTQGFEPVGFLHGDPGWKIYTEKQVIDTQEVMAGIAVGLGYDVKEFDEMIWNDDIDECRVVFEALGIRFRSESHLYEEEKTTRPENVPKILEGVALKRREEPEPEKPKIDLTRDQRCEKDHRVCNVCQLCSCSRKMADNGKRFRVLVDGKGRVLCPDCRTELNEKEKVNA